MVGKNTKLPRKRGALCIEQCVDREAESQTADQHAGAGPGERSQGLFRSGLRAVHGERAVHDQLIDRSVPETASPQHHLTPRTGPARDGLWWLVHASSIPPPVRTIVTP